MELYRYKATLWDETGNNEYEVYGVVAGETPADAFQRIYNHYFDILISINVEFDEPNGGIKEMGLEDTKEIWERMGEY